MSKRDKLIQFVRENVDEEFDAEQDSLVEIMDSVSFLRLIVFIEQEFNVQLDMASIRLESFADIDTLMNMLEEFAEAV